MWKRVACALQDAGEVKRYHLLVTGPVLQRQSG